MLHIFNVFVRSKGVAGHPSANYIYTEPLTALIFARKTRDDHSGMIVSVAILKQFPSLGIETEHGDFSEARQKREKETVFLTTWPLNPGDPWVEKFSPEFEELIKSLTSEEEVTVA